MTKPQVILDDSGKPAFAVIPWREYARLAMVDAAAGLTDEELYDHAKSLGGESFPIEVADRLLAGGERRQSIPGPSQNDSEAVGRCRWDQPTLSIADRKGCPHRLGSHLVRPRRGTRRRCGRPDLIQTANEKGTVTSFAPCYTCVRGVRMTLEQITTLVASQESETLEFKSTTGTRREAAKTMCAMLNHSGGYVLFGVSPDGDVVGQQVSDRVTGLLRG